MSQRHVDDAPRDGDARAQPRRGAVERPVRHRAAVQTADPSERLRPYALRAISTASFDFVTIMDSDRTRYTHPNPAQLGLPYIGSVKTALSGKSQIEEYAGTLGLSVRAIAPIFMSRGL